MASPLGNFLPLNLGPRYTGATSHLPLNLGVDWWHDDPDPPDPPEPVVRGLRRDAGMPWGRAAAVRARSSRVAWGTSPSLRRSTRTPWGNAPLVARAWRLPWGSLPLQRRDTSMAWRGLMPRTSRDVRVPWSTLPLERQSASMSWLGRLAREARAAGIAWRAPGLARLSRSMPWLARLSRAERSSWVRWHHPGQARPWWDIPWGPAGRIPWDVTPRPPEPPAPPESPFPPGNFIGLNLGCALVNVPGLAPLNLGVTACYAVRPRRRTYIVLNSVAVVRLPDMLPIEVDSVNIGASADAWGSTFDLSLCDPAQLALLKPNANGPREVQVTLNGYVWTAVIESYSSRKEFVAGGVSVSGRSRTALMAPPYAPLRSKVATLERSAAQLVDEELAGTDYAASFESPDWLVPADAWYYDGLSPMDAIARIAEACGAVVQSDPATLDLRIRPRYPASPWDWTETAPDVIVHDDIVNTHALQVRSQPLYDAVVVTGEIAGKGVTVRVKRAGEAGTLYAPQASHQLVTTPAVGAERGRNILADRGEQASIDLTLPLFPEPLGPGETGRILPLDLVEVLEDGEVWHGLCTAVQVQVSALDRAIVIEQTVTLERHYTDAD